MRLSVLLGDCAIRMSRMEAGSVAAVVCDPPYGLEFMSKSWDKLDWRMTAGLATGGSERFRRGPPWPSYSSATSENRVCRVCKGTERGQDRKGFNRCRCEAGDFPPRRFTTS